MEEKIQGVTVPEERIGALLKSNGLIVEDKE